MAYDPDTVHVYGPHGVVYSFTVAEYLIDKFGQRFFDRTFKIVDGNIQLKIRAGEQSEWTDQPVGKVKL